MSNTLTANTPSFNFNNHSIEATYSFSEYSGNSKTAKSNKVWLNMMFTHPVKEEPIVVRAAKSSRLLSQPKEVIEAIAQRDLRNYLSSSMAF